MPSARDRLLTMMMVTSSIDFILDTKFEGQHFHDKSQHDFSFGVSEQTSHILFRFDKGGSRYWISNSCVLAQFIITILLKSIAESLTLPLKF